jgi:8-oxo-dGTP pyrophosphatase MutT (NUDIX family)
MLKYARDETVKLTTLKGASLPYRKRAEVFAIMPDGSIVARIKRSSAGGLYVEVPGGGIDEGEGPVTAVRREALEECGITLKNIKLISKVVWKWPPSMQKAMGSWANKYAGEDNHIFIAEVDTVSKPTSEEGDGWDKLQTKTPKQLEIFLLGHMTGGYAPINGNRLKAVKTIKTNTYSQSTLEKKAHSITLQDSNVNKEAYIAGYLYKLDNK